VNQPGICRCSLIDGFPWKTGILKPMAFLTGNVSFYADKGGKV